MRKYRLQVARRQLAREVEEQLPIPRQAIVRVCEQGMIVDLSSPHAEGSRSYREYLEDLHLPGRHFIYSFLDMGATWFSTVLVVIVGLGPLAIWQHGRCAFPFESACETVVLERKTTFPIAGNQASNAPPINERGYIQTRPESSILQSKRLGDRGVLDLSLATLLGALIAFFYANFQWRMGNRQASINEFFQRKKDINLLLLENESVRPFLKEAVDRRSLSALPVKRLTSQESEDTLNLIQNLLYLEDIENFSFDQKMFVFLEIDNLEFALEKYSSGYLDHGQMYRACEIFQSRCYNRGFRYLAATQGLVYYKDELRKIIGSMIIRGHYFETVAISEPERKQES